MEVRSRAWRCRHASCAQSRGIATAGVDRVCTCGAEISVHIKRWSVCPRRASELDGAALDQLIDLNLVKSHLIEHFAGVLAQHRWRATIGHGCL